MIARLLGIKKDGRQFAKAQLHGYKNIRLGGARYTIRRINPILDFHGDRMPAVFSAYSSVRKVDPAKAAELAMSNPTRALEEMMMVVAAGVVSPVLVPQGKGEAKGREDGITVEDLFRDTSHGTELYIKIIKHTFARYSAWRLFLMDLRSRWARANAKAGA